ncbi:MAG: mechanosensitive ion channel family protein [Prevotella sp.]|nr:mechanosensitive ion channel family protein [Prevotella sp.]
MNRILSILLMLCWVLTGSAQEQDSVRQRMDSLQRELHEMKMKEMVLRNALDESGRGAREDSLRKVEQKQRIDSLRKVTPGVPLVIDGDTLLIIYTSLGGDDPAHRVESVARKVTQIGKSLKLTTDSMHIFVSEYTDDVMCGEVVIVRVSDLDGLWNGMSRRDLAEEYLRILSVEIERLHADYGLKAKLTGLGWAVFLIVVQVVFFMLTARFIRYLRRKIAEGVNGRMKPLIIKGYELMNVPQQKRILLVLTRVLQIFLVLLQLFISLPLLFSIFPETEKFTWNMINYVWSPLRDMVVSIVRYFPNLVKIFVIIYVVRWVLKGLHHISDEIAVGHLKIDRFYQDWAQPTYHIIRIFVIAFTLVVIWPLLPGSESGVFKGVSIFVAALFSLGSTTTIGNLISGIIITYMRPFLVGDFVRIGEQEGEVIEKNAFITRLRDIKGNLVTVPNNSILSQQTVNYTAAARDGKGSIVHSTFTFTYHVPRETVEAYLLEGAARCQLLEKNPKPFVLYTALEDFYTQYEINGYTKETARLFAVYSELHRHIIDVFHEHNLDPTSSHFIKVQEVK